MYRNKKKLQRMFLKKNYKPFNDYWEYKTHIDCNKAYNLNAKPYKKLKFD